MTASILKAISQTSVDTPLNPHKYRQALRDSNASSAITPNSPAAAYDYFAAASTALNAFGSFVARSDRLLRSNAIFAFLSAAMNLL